MVKQALFGGQEIARKIPKFVETGNGAIVMMCVPLSWEEDGWFGNLSESDDNYQLTNVHRYIHVAAISSGGSHVINWVDPDDEHVEPVNCRVYAMAKIAYLERLVENRIPSEAYDAEAETFLEANCYSRRKGAICSTYRFGEQELMRIYDAFSGASEEEDLQCAVEVAKNRFWTIQRFSKEVTCTMQSVSGLIDQ